MFFDFVLGSMSAEKVFGVATSRVINAVIYSPSTFYAEISVKSRSAVHCFCRGRAGAIFGGCSEILYWKFPMRVLHFVVQIFGKPHRRRSHPLVAGKQVAVVDKKGLLGGVCVHTGTIPSKTFRYLPRPQLRARSHLFNVVVPVRCNRTQSGWCLVH